MANPTAAEAQFRIEQAAAEAKSGLREISRIEVGEAIRQGDIYVRRLAELPAERGKKTELRQLAPGTTQARAIALKVSAQFMRQPKNGIV